MELRSVREACSSKSRQYIDLFDGDWDAHEVDAAFIRRHLGRSRGPVLDLSCGPGYWAAYLHTLGIEVTGIDLVPELIGHARVHHPGPDFQLGSMPGVQAPEHSADGVLSWYSTIHVPPVELGALLARFRRLLRPSGPLVLGFFASDDDVAAFEHAVVTAYRWPADLLTQHLVEAGLADVEGIERRVADRPDRRYAALAARAV